MSRLSPQDLLSVTHLDVSHNMIYEIRSAFAPLALVRFNIAHNHLENLFGLEVPHNLKTRASIIGALSFLHRG